MAVVHAKRIQILFISVLAIWLNLNIISGHQSPSHHHCDHSHHHHQDDHSVFTAEKLPEELAEEEDLRMFESASHYSRHQDHDNHHYGGASSELSGVGLWINAMGCSLLVCLASFICLIALPFIFIQGKPSKTIVDSLAIFGAGAMLGDAFLHQLPHAFGVEHAPSHSHLVDNAHHHAAHGHDHSHSHSLKDLSVGLSVLVGIVLFLLVEKVVRYVEDMSAGVNMWSHGHHHHHRKVDKTSKDVNQDDKQVDESSLIDKDGSISEMQSEEKVSQKLCDRSFIVEKQNESALRKRLTSTNAGENSIDEGAEDGPHDHTKFMTEKESIQSSSNLVFGYLNLFSDGVHNFSDGMALGSAFLLYGSVGGWSRTLFLLAHELPQEIGDFGILVRSGFSIPKALFFNFLSALVALAGTALALLWGQDPTQSSLIEGFTAGGFIYLAVAGVLAEVNSVTSGLKDTAIQLTSLIMGISVALFISLAE